MSLGYIPSSTGLGGLSNIIQDVAGGQPGLRLSKRLTGTLTKVAGSVNITGLDTLFTTELEVNDAVRIGQDTFTVLSITDATNMIVTVAATVSESSVSGRYDPNLWSVKTGNDFEQASVSKNGHLMCRGIISNNYITSYWIKDVTPDLDSSIHAFGRQLDTGDIISHVIIKINTTITFSGGGSLFEIGLIPFVGGGSFGVNDIVTNEGTLSAGSVLEFSRAAGESSLVPSLLVTTSNSLAIQPNTGSFTAGQVDVYVKLIKLL